MPILDINNVPEHVVVPLSGYISPLLVFITLINNTMVVVVLRRKNMRSPTNTLLVAMAIADMFTGAIPVPMFIYFYAMGHYKEYVAYNWCYTYKYLMDVIPTIFHTASIWLTVALAVQRYIYICHSFQARTWCTIQNAIRGTIGIYVVATASQLTRFFDFEYRCVDVQSKLNPDVIMTSCTESLQTWAVEVQDIYLSIYWWFRVIFIHFIPCTSLVVLNGLLINAMRNAQKRRKMLLKQNKKSESKQIKDSNCTTLMLVAVVGLFLLVEFPLGIIIILVIVQNAFEVVIIKDTLMPYLTLISNFFILLSYPLNFFIYCGMSRQFRETFKQLFFGSSSPALERDCSQYMTLPTENGRTAVTGAETAL